MAVVNSNYLVHSGGTKFYEIVQITNAPAKRFVEIRRWGKAELGARAGGQIQILEHKSAGALADSAGRQLRTKQNKGYGGAVGASGNFGLHSLAGGMSGVTLTDEDILKHLHKHFGDGEDRARIIEAAQIDPSGNVEETMDQSEFDVPKEPQPEPDRGETWGSW
jgi:predicted DNA-binding WGR domain protein